MAKAYNMRSNEGGRITVFHVIVVSLSLILTIGAWAVSKNQIEDRTAARFEAARDRAIGLIEDRMKKYEDALAAGVAAIESHGGDISYQAWRSFAHTLNINEEYPGINGIGVIHYHTAQSLDEYLAEQQSERPGFRVFPDHDQTIYMPITFIEPEDTNAAAVGLDVAHELNRRTAALASRDTGTAQITGPIALVQDANSTAGFLFYRPFYRGEPPHNVSDRQEQFAGAVYAPFVVHKLMEGLLAKELRHVRFSIMNDGVLIYDEHVADDPAFDPDPMFSELVSLQIYGRTWTLDLRSDLVFRNQNIYAKPTIILFGGLLIEVLIVSLLYLMSQANKRAAAYADQVTAALRQESAKLAETNAELSRKNNELEQFSYVTSHDLKTPIRGIGGLTEMIEEDLEEYLSSPQGNPDIRDHLALIHDRVRRMDQLTSGIMQFSQVGQMDAIAPPAKLDAVVVEMSHDFELEDGQLRLAGDVEIVHTDSFTFRRVLENLVGNAVKYHDGVDKLDIAISVNAVGDRLHVSVTDNGAGIDSKFHDRIFKVFQTLRTGDMQESTGIGLSIVKKAVERHGGQINLMSSPGNGASFSFCWPNEPTAGSTDMKETAA